jgi:hypothetical protein
MIYVCCSDLRREEVLSRPEWNGIDFLEVLDDPALPVAERERVLFVHFVRPLAVPLTREDVRIEGGERIRDIAVDAVYATHDDDVLAIRLDRAGDFSTYTLRLVADPDSPGSSDRLATIDPALSAIEFSFKIDCSDDLDCAPRPCPPERPSEPEVDYLARDYGSFRQLMLDRIATLAPDWKERNPADVGVALVEAIAYRADQLAYAQDAIATEAYLGTARRRISVRRHARLVDYAMHDGSNARVWVQIQVDTDVPPDPDGAPALPTGSQLLTRAPGLGAVLARGSDAYVRARQARVEVFETLHDVAAVFEDHNELTFYTWSADDCCLPLGSTAATLAGHHPNLEPGMVLVFLEALGPRTGVAGDANPGHRHAVRLTACRAIGAGGAPLTDPVDDDEITEIEWSAADALPFSLCISTTVRTVNEDGDPVEVQATGVSVALGNIVLADHGELVGSPLLEPLGAVPESTGFWAVEQGSDQCTPERREPRQPAFRPTLASSPVTQAATIPDRPGSGAAGQAELRRSVDLGAPASNAFRWEMRDVLPWVRLRDGKGRTWRPQRDLLASDASALEFVVEVDDEGIAQIRFGDDRYGQQPEAGLDFGQPLPPGDPLRGQVGARYRIGNGTRGNVGHDTIAHLVADAATERLAAAVVGVRNPLPARGGVDPETIEEVRTKAPVAFRTQQRAVTPDDYAKRAEEFPDIRLSEVERAVATFRWTGSWRTVFVSVDRRGSEPIDDEFEARLRTHLERFRMAGHDVEIDRPRMVPIELEIQVCVAPTAYRSAVREGLLDVLSNRDLPDGRRGMFHPDNLTFGRPVYLSPIYAAAQSVPGVASVEVTRFVRWGGTDRKAIDEGRLTLSRLEVARLDNDPSFPDRGVLRLFIEGGK